MSVLDGLQPEAIFKYFEEISNIPRGSGNEAEISKYLVDFAEKRGLYYYKDEYLNVLIVKKGAYGLEDAEPVIIQGHTDMVCEKNAGTVHDFLKDPLKLYIEDDYIKARGTSLGADNGVAVAYALAILDSKSMKHPPIEALFTSDEERGLSGANMFDYSLLAGKTLINIDSGDEGKILVSCSGGIRYEMKMRIKWIMSWISPKENSVYYKIKVSGLKGGHSGVDISEERGNSIKLIGRILYHLNSKVEYNLSEVSGGAKENAIPRESFALVTISKKDEQKLIDEINILQEIYKRELRAVEPNLSVVCEHFDDSVIRTFSEQSKEKLISLLMLLPNGAQTYSKEIKGLVETSTNVGVLKIVDDDIIIDSAIRSSIKSKKKYVVEQLKEISSLFSLSSKDINDYPEWEFSPKSKIREVFKEVYKDMYGKEIIEEAVHAGLECGIFSDKIEGVDLISFGPDIFGTHTPEERLSISSYARTWEFLVKILERLDN